MTKSQKPTGTLDQLRSLMQTQKFAHSGPEHAPVTVTAATSKPSSPAVVKSTQPPAQKSIVHPRFTVRLSASELAKLGDLVLTTHQNVGERITATDVLRIGLGRVGEHSPITHADVARLRMTDARRNRRERAF